MKYDYIDFGKRKYERGTHMLEFFQIVFLKSIIAVTIIILVLLIFENKRTIKFIRNDINKTLKNFNIIIILTIIICTLNIKLSIIYLEINVLFLLNIMIVLINFKFNKLNKFGVITLIGSFLALTIIRFIYQNQ